MKRLLCGMLTFAALVGCCDSACSEDLIRYIDPFIGTAGTGHCFPHATVPFGAVQAGPVSGMETWPYTAGYQHGDTKLYGFVQNALSGTGGCDLGDVLIQPFTGEIDSRDLFTYDKADERCGAGWYSVRYPQTGVSTVITATPRVALYDMDFGGAEDARLLTDFQWGTVGKKRFPHHVLESEVEFVDERTIKVHNRLQAWSKREYWAVMRFNMPCSSHEKLPRRSLTEKGDRYVLGFKLKAGEGLKVKIAMSARSFEGALRNLDLEAKGWDFRVARSAAQAAWRGVVSRVAVVGSEEQKKGFYTALYHLCIQPNDYSDVGGKPFYTTLSCWDTFRAAGPLYTVLFPERVDGFIESMLDQCDITGFMPIWTLGGHDNQCMIGTHSIPMVVDAYLKGFRGFDVNRAYAAIRQTLTEKHESRYKEQWDLYDQYGYYPFDKIRGESVSRTLECSYDDWCAAQLAERLGKADDRDFFLKRAAYWKNVFDTSVGMARGKDSSGKWRTPFNPYELGHGADRDNDFTEGNSFQYSWHVMQDPDGLVSALGGKEKAVQRLDALFSAPPKVEGEGENLDVTGLIGQYVHGNEPSHHVIYFYSLLGHPEKAADRIREVFDTQYNLGPDGLCGNDDCGQMSAWYIFSALGFYPFNPCGGEYVLGAPQVPKAVLSLPDGKIFTMTAVNLSRENSHVKSVFLNGKPVAGCKIHHADIVNGGELVFNMGR